MRPIQLLCLAGLLAFAAPAGAQSKQWHKAFNYDVAYPSYCQLQATGGHYLALGSRDFKEIDQFGTVTGAYDNSLIPGYYWTGILKKYDAGTGHPYFIQAGRAVSSTSLGLSEFEPGKGSLHEFSLADQAGSLSYPAPQVIPLNDSVLIVIGSQYYYQLVFTRDKGFTQIWKRNLSTVLGFSPKFACFRQQLLILADETGQVAALDDSGNLVWSRQHAIGLRALHPTGDGLIGCGVTTDGKSALVRLNADGTAIWTVSGTDQVLYDVVPAADGGFAATGVSAAANILLARYDGAGALLWRRELGTGNGGSILQAADGGFLLMAMNKAQASMHLIKTDAAGSAPDVEAGQLGERSLATKALAATFIASPNLFLDYSGGGLRALTDGNTTTIATCAPWIAGLDAGQQLHLSVADYPRFTQADYRPGLADAPAADFNRVWKVTRADIRTLRAGYALGALDAQAIPYDVLTWPGKGNPNLRYNLDFTPVTTDPALFPAPFVDVNGDGRYNALDGDYPRIEGDQMLWWTLTDNTTHQISNGMPLITDLSVSVFAYDCTDNPLVDGTVFADFSLHNRSSQDYTGAYLGFFTDIDLGCSDDDYTGSIPASHTIYGYNADSMDSTNCGAGFAADIPVQTVSMLDQSLDKAMYYNNPSYLNPAPPTTDPDLSGEYYRYLQGIWKDGTPLTSGGSGFNAGSTDYTDFAFPDNPADPQGWTMCSTALPLYDQRLVAVHGPFSFPAGDEFNLRLAFTLHRGVPLPCPDIFGLVQPNLALIRQWNDAGAFDLNSGLSPIYVLQPGKSLNLDASVPQGLYQWSTGANTPNISVNAPGAYSVTITGATGCSHTETVEVRKSASAAAPAAPAWRLWPNPAADLVRIQTTDGNAAALSARLFDAQGRLLRQQTGAMLDLSGLPAGLYWVELRDRETALGVRKVVKE